MAFLVRQVTNLHPFPSIISRFQDTAHFMIFPLAPILKFQMPQQFYLFIIFLTDRQQHSRLPYVS